jgi:H/ACA ribonucleoprotein complex subunit 3
MTESVLKVCRACARYTLKDACPSCGGATRTPHPARFDATDRYGAYRRRLLEAVRAETGAR